MRKIIITILMALLMPMVTGAQEPYAVLSDDNSVLTFYYDNQKAERNGMDVRPFGDYVWNGYVYEFKAADWQEYRKSITSVVFDDSFSGCTTLKSTAYWFWSLRYLSSITGISNLKTDNVTDMSCMFAGCLELRSIDLTGFKTDNVTNMSGIFMNCWSLETPDLTGFKTDSVTDMSYMFNNCFNQTKLDVTGFNTENVTNMERMFEGCYRLTSIDMTEFNTEKVTNMVNMFSGCSSLTSLDLTGFNTGNVNYMDGMFSDCSSLATIYAGKGWSTNRIKNYGSGLNMFNGCSSLVGGAGTKYNENHTDYTYAHIDGGRDNPGYFTAAGSETGIDTIHSLHSPAHSYYTLDGRKLQSEPTNKGVYVVDGRKVIIK